MKQTKKVTTNLAAIQRAEQELGVVYPEPIREKLLQTNGFDSENYHFYCVRDDEDLYHTFDDVVRENTNTESGWKQYLPEGYAAIAEDGGKGCLAIQAGRETSLYYFESATASITQVASSLEEIAQFLR